jgi:hypothetical protein
MKSKVIVLLLAILTTGGNLLAQTTNNDQQKAAAIAADVKPAAEKKSDTLSFWSELRLRYELQDNYNYKNYGDTLTNGEYEDFMLARLRAGLAYNPLDFLKISVGAQYAGAWGESLNEEDFYNKEFGKENNTLEESPELFDCYVEVTDPFVKIATLKVGRQQLAYGDTRVFTTGNWSNTTTWLWDAAKLSLKYQKHFLDIYYGQTEIHESDQLSVLHKEGYESYGFYGHVQIAALFKEIGIEPFGLTKKNEQNDNESYKSETSPAVYGDLDSYFYGARIYGKDLYGFDFDATYIKEGGDYSTDEIDAYAYHVLLGYTLKAISLKPGLSAEYSYASGDSDSSDGKHKTFDTAFTGKTLFGKMGMMAWKNIKDFQVNFSIKPVDKMDLKVSYHKFELAESADKWYFNGTVFKGDKGKSDIGQEIDVCAKFDIIKGSNLEVGYSHFFIGDYVKEFEATTGTQADANWFYLQWTSKLNFGIL